MAAQLIHVVRHAHAGDPSAWTLDDDLRPLSERGIGQAERLVGVLAVPRPAVVYSSPSLRCLATVLPLARYLSLPLTTLPELYEGGGAEALIDRLAGEASPVVACTHGDILADLLSLLLSRGITLPSQRTEKGSTWTVEVSDGAISSARYASAP
jgi:broad specificity phosphatase PhoE